MLRRHNGGSLYGISNDRHRSLAECNLSVSMQLCACLPIPQVVEEKGKEDKKMVCWCIPTRAKFALI